MNETAETDLAAFTVNGNTFVNAAAAIQRSCAIQNNAWYVSIPP
jgi:hypothetical protein